MKKRKRKGEDMILLAFSPTDRELLELWLALGPHRNARRVPCRAVDLRGYDVQILPGMGLTLVSSRN
ncbi:MAG: hypothetical protein ACNS63_04235 [Candidatus Nitrospinota bacterium M3_3B_026]